MGAKLAYLAAALATLGLGLRCAMFGGSATCLVGGILAFVERDAPGVGAAGLFAAAAGLAATLGPFLLGVMRLRAAQEKAEREERRREARLAAEMEVNRARLDWMDGQMLIKDRRIEDLEQMVVENRASQNQVRGALHPPLRRVPEGPVERRVKERESGQYPAVPEPVPEPDPDDPTGGLH